MFKAMWWQGVPWGAQGDCVGLAENCNFAVGASQMGLNEALTGHTDPILNGMTYAQLKSSYMSNSTAVAVGFPDAAMIPST